MTTPLRAPEDRAWEPVPLEVTTRVAAGNAARRLDIPSTREPAARGICSAGEGAGVGTQVGRKLRLPNSSVPFHRLHLRALPLSLIHI